jgi:RNA polymerase primary sigma factor
MRKLKVRRSGGKTNSHQVAGTGVAALVAARRVKPLPAAAPASHNGNGHSTELASAPRIQPLAGHSAAELDQKIKELVRLAQEQGHLTHNDVNEALPDNFVSPEIMDEIYVKLRNLEIEIVDQAEVDRVRQPEAEEEDE